MRFYEFEPNLRLCEAGDNKEYLYAAIAPTWEPYDDSSRPRLTFRKLGGIRRRKDKKTISNARHQQLVQQMYGVSNFVTQKQQNRHEP